MFFLVFCCFFLWRVSARRPKLLQATRVGPNANRRIDDVYSFMLVFLCIDSRRCLRLRLSAVRPFFCSRKSISIATLIHSKTACHTSVSV